MGCCAQAIALGLPAQAMVENPLQKLFFALSFAIEHSQGASWSGWSLARCPGPPKLLWQCPSGSCLAQGRDRRLPWHCHGHNRAGLGKGLGFMSHGIPARITSHFTAVICLVINSNHLPMEFPWQWIGRIHSWNSHLTGMRVRSNHGNSKGISAFPSLPFLNHTLPEGFPSHTHLFAPKPHDDS